MAKRQSKYDDDLLVELLARGELSYAQIAERVGISESMVSKISRGETRPELQGRIDGACEGLIAQAKRLGARLAPIAMARLGALAGKTKEDEEPVHPEIQRKAAVDIMKFTLGDPSKPEVSVSQQQHQGADLTGLTPETKAQVLEELGGPK